MNLFRQKISLLRQHRALAFYGAALSLVHLVTAFYWSRQDIANHFSYEYAYTFCWPFFSGCRDWRLLSETSAQALIYVYGSLAVIASGLFLFRRASSAAYFCLCILFFMKTYLYAQSYGLMGNYHYMSLIIDFVFLFLPGAERLLPVLVISFYFFAGAIKINSEWISGASVPFHWIGGKHIYHWLYTRPSFAIPMSIYAAFMELVVVFGLLHRRLTVFCFAFLNLVVFHLFSWGIVGYLYPLIMLCLIAIFPLLRIFPLESSSALSAQVAPLWQKPKNYVPALAFSAIFAFLQIWPRLLPGDSALTGQGRIYALNMLDAMTECTSVSYAQIGSEKVNVSYERKLSNFSVRLWCEPYVYFYRAKDLCAEFQHLPDFQGISLHLAVKRRMEPKYTTVVAEQNICEHSYSSFFANKWIRSELLP